MKTGHEPGSPVHIRRRFPCFKHFLARRGVLDFQQFVMPADGLGVDFGLGVEAEGVPHLELGDAQAEGKVLTVRVLVELLPGLDRQIPDLLEDR